MKLFVGLDVSLAKTAVCVLTEHGKIIEEVEVISEPEPLISLLEGLEGTVEAVGLEAGPLSQWLHRAMKEIGLPAVLMETRQVKGALKAMPIKTDRRDAEGIARLLHLGWFRPVHCKSVSAQEVRAVLAARKAIQGNMIALEMSLRGLLRNFGLKVGAISRGRFEARIWELVEGNTMLEAAAAPMLRVRAALRQELAGLEKLVRQKAAEDPVCLRLMTMPGVGAVVALTFRSAVDDPFFEECRSLGWSNALSQSVWRAGCIRRHHQSRGCEPKACPVSGCYGHAESRAWQRTTNMGIPCCQTPRTETRDGCPGSPYCCRVASHVDRRIDLQDGGCADQLSLIASPA